MKMYEQVETCAEVWRKYLPKMVQLYYVNYDDNLDNQHEVLQKCIESNNLYPLNDVVFDFWDYPESEYLAEIQRKMDEDGLGNEYHEHEDEIKDYLWEHDESTPVMDLLRNTTYPKFFYSLGIDLDHGWNCDFMAASRQNEAYAQSARRICQALGIKEDTPEVDAVLDLCINSPYGGELRIYFEASVVDMITDDKWDSEKGDWKTIHFRGKCAVAVWDNTNGAGDFVKIEIDKEFPFVRENLQISDVAEKYDIDSSCGLCGDWLDDCVKPEFSYEKKSGNVNVSEAVKREREFQRIFDAGGCSVGDSNLGRHHGVYYRNKIPCGWYCPNCGKIWYD